MKRPNPFLHMIAWGFGSGIVLAMLYAVFIVSLGRMGIAETLTALFSPELWQLALLVGGVPGAGLGLLMGLILWSISHKFPIPFTRADMLAARRDVYIALGGTTAVGAIVLIWLFFNSSLSYLWSFLIFPPIIAGIAAAYAGHRYLFRLRLWSESQFGAEKAKNIARLEDKLKNEDLDDGNTSEAQEQQSS